MKETTLGLILRGMYESAFAKDRATNIHLFGIYYAEIIKNDKLNKKEILKAAGLPVSYDTEISKGMRLSQYVMISDSQVKRITEIQNSIG